MKTFKVRNKIINLYFFNFSKNIILGTCFNVLFYQKFNLTSKMLGFQYDKFSRKFNFFFGEKEFLKFKLPDIRHFLRCLNPMPLAFQVESYDCDMTRATQIVFYWNYYLYYKSYVATKKDSEGPTYFYRIKLTTFLKNKRQCYG